MDSNRTVWVILAILLIPIYIVLSGWLSSRVETTEAKISAYLIAIVFLLVELGLLVEVMLADLAYWIIDWGLNALSELLLAPFGQRVSDIAVSAKRVLILVCVGAWIIDLVTKVAGVAERLIPCEAVWKELLNAPCDVKLLAQCPFTAPLARLVLQDMADLPMRASCLLGVTLEYLGLCTDLTYILLLAVLLSGLPRRLWWRLGFSLSSLIGEGRVSPG